MLGVTGMLNATYLLMMLIVALTEGLLNPFWIWNAMPIVISFLLMKRAASKSLRPMPEYAFMIFGCGLVVVVHLAWAFDWGELATGSSTSGLIFLFLPIYAVIAGGAVFWLTFLFGGRIASTNKEERRDA